MPTYESKKRSFDLKELSSTAVFDRQMKEQMAMDDVGMRLTLTAPNGRKGARDVTPKKVFVKTFSNSGEPLALRVVKGDRARPMNRGVGD